MNIKYKTEHNLKKNQKYKIEHNLKKTETKTMRSGMNKKINIDNGLLNNNLAGK